MVRALYRRRGNTHLFYSYGGNRHGGNVLCAIKK